MTIINKIPFLGKIDENLYRFSAIFLLFVIFGITATQFTNKVWKLVLSLSAVIFALQAFAFITESSKVDDFGLVKDLRKTLPNLNISSIYKIGFAISIFLFAICLVTIASKKNILIYGLSAMMIISSLSIFILKPQYFMNVKQKPAEKTLVSVIKHGRLIAPNTHWSTIGTWYGIESVHGYSLPNNSNYAIDETYRGCKFHAGFVFIPCDYLTENKTVYDLGNIQWAILKDGSEKVHSDIKKYATLDNGYSLYERPSGESSIFALNGKCSSYAKGNIADLDLAYLKSEHKYIESTGKYIFEKQASKHDVLISKDTCLLFSVAYHEELKVTSDHDLKTVDLHSYTAIDIKTSSLDKAQEWSIKYDNPNYLFSKILGLIGLLTLGGIYFSKKKQSLKT